MRVYYDIDSDILMVQPGIFQPIDVIEFKRAMQCTLEVQFFQKGIITELPYGATGIFGIKETGKYDADYAVVAPYWRKSGAGTTAVYTFLLSFINATLDALFKIDTDLTNDVVSIDFMAELQWSLSNVAHKSKTVTVRIFNDINRGDEGSPLPPEPPPDNVDTVDVVASEDLPALCLVTSGGEQADSNNPLHFNRVIGMTMQAVAVDNIAVLVTEGEVTDPSWNWMPNQKLFLNGTAISNAPPSAGAFSQFLGLTRNSQTIFVRPQVPVFL